MEDNSDHQLYFPSTIEIKQVESFVLNDHDEVESRETDAQSSTDTIIATKEIQAIFNRNSSQQFSSYFFEQNEKNL